jgi:regulator of replication initiation timing
MDILIIVDTQEIHDFLGMKFQDVQADVLDMNIQEIHEDLDTLDMNIQEIHEDLDALDMNIQEARDNLLQEILEDHEDQEEDLMLQKLKAFRSLIS